MTTRGRSGPLSTKSRRSKRRQIVERDGLVCWICEGLTNPDAPLDSPQSLSVDHVQPLHLGGRHDLANLKLAHKGCNVRRNLGLEEAA